MNCSICGKSVTVISETSQANPSLICAECTTASNSNNADSPPAQVKNVCRNHPTVEVDLKCDKCGSFICKTCEFPQHGGKSLCPECIQKSVPNKKSPPVILVPEGTMCSIHPNVPAIRNCQICNLPVCNTCNFEFPNDINICPNCVNKPLAPSPRQKKNLIISYVLASLGTLSFFLCMYMERLFGIHMSEQALGIIFFASVLGPGIAGLSFAISARTRNRKKPLSIWMAMIWNAILIGILLTLSIIGSFM